MAGVGLAGLAAALTACGASGGSGAGTAQGIDCPCHGSEFSVKNGSVVSGPAPSPLPRKSVTVAGGKITLA
jgi:Rieske Fe-S protein